MALCMCLVVRSRKQIGDPNRRVFDLYGFIFTEDPDLAVDPAWQRQAIRLKLSIRDVQDSVLREARAGVDAALPLSVARQRGVGDLGDKENLLDVGITTDKIACSSFKHHDVRLGHA